MDSTAERLALAGANAALDHAVREMSDWEVLAMGYVREFARKHAELRASEVREYAAARGFTEAPEPRAWGAIMRRSQRECVILPTSRWEATARISSHGRPERVWQSRLFGQ